MNRGSGGARSAPSHPSLRDAEPAVYWLEDPDRPAPTDPLAGPTEAELVVVGGGYLGLWTALLALERRPGLDVLVVEADECGQAASGRNGGFCEASLTHGFGNGLARWPAETGALLDLGRANLDAIERTVAEERIDCDFIRPGVLSVATGIDQLAALDEEVADSVAHGRPVERLGPEQLRARLDSPTYRGGLHDPQAALVEPARLAWGLRAACLRRGVRIAEGTAVRSLAARGGSATRGVELRTDAGPIRARQVVLATNAYRPLLRRLRLMAVPVFDHALISEPLTEQQRRSIGWAGREGVSDRTRRFHYYRTTRDGRILWGGYDALYHFGSSRDRRLEQRPETSDVLAANFFATFPQLHGLRFTHRWGGMIDTCTRFTAFYGTALDGRVGYALGFTGLGVAATRFAAEVLLDLLAGEETERTRLEMVRSRPLPFPPEPLRWAGIQTTRRALARADEIGRETWWLRALDRIGWGFDS